MAATGDDRSLAARAARPSRRSATTLWDAASPPGNPPDLIGRRRGLPEISRTFRVTSLDLSGRSRDLRGSSRYLSGGSRNLPGTSRSLGPEVGRTVGPISPASAPFHRALPPVPPAFASIPRRAGNAPGGRVRPTPSFSGIAVAAAAADAAGMPVPLHATRPYSCSFAFIGGSSPPSPSSRLPSRSSPFDEIRAGHLRGRISLRVGPRTRAGETPAPRADTLSAHDPGAN